VFVGTAGLTKEIDMGGFTKPSKRLEAMKQGEKIKGAGSNYYDLPRHLFCNVRSGVLQDTKKEALYRLGETPDRDLHEVEMCVLRGKSNQSGTPFSVICSQFMGMLTETTHYHMLREAGYVGLNGSQQRHQPCFTPDVTITRNTMRETARDNYEVRRALEICAHLLIIQNYWQPREEFALGWQLTPEQLYEQLQKAGSAKISDIVNSVSYWSPDGTCDRPYMSIFDILELLPK